MSEPVNLADLAFDFENYFDRHSRGELTERQEAEFDARVIGLFCRRVLTSATANSAWNKYEDFAACYLAKKLVQVAGGVPWRALFHLPFDGAERESDFTPRGARAVSIYCDVKNAHKAKPATAITELIAQQADAYCVSYETARSDYYAVKAAIDDGKGFSPFSKN